MFDMGFLELLLIGIIALIVLGPERLPKAARTVGLWIGKAKQGFDSIKTEIDRELKVKELQEQIAEQKQKLENELNVKSEFSTITDDVNQTVNSIQKQSDSLGSVYQPEEEKISETSVDTLENTATTSDNKTQEKQN